MDTPVFVPVQQGLYPAQAEVFVYKTEDEVRIIPLDIIWHHEIVNDIGGGEPVVLSYCPLTRSAVAWEAGEEYLPGGFDVSGYLFRQNLVPFDRQNEIYYSQMWMKAVSGPAAGRELIAVPFTSMNYHLASVHFPDAVILVTPEGVVCDSVCGQGYKSLTAGDDPFGVLFRNSALLFNSELFETAGNLFMIHWKSYDLLVTGSVQHRVAGAWLRPDGRTFYGSLQPEFYAFNDDMGNYYNWLGEVFEGPEKGSRLTAPPAFRAAMFAWEDFYPDYELFKKE
ncbi:MAG: DUF3179 domain-containing protein [Bacteroidales bacterium]